MDRPIVSVSELGRVEDFHGLAKAALYSIGTLAEATIGPAVGVAGLAIAATGPPSMSFSIGRGSIYTLATVDTSAYGITGTDSNTIVKQGINPAPVTLGPIVAPSTSGYSQYYVVQVAFNEVDTNSIVPPYFNTANPLVPLNGAGGAGGFQNTLRQDKCVIALKAGAAAPTGSQVVPTVDPGYTALYSILVANGQTTITSANWAQLSAGPYSAPWFPNLESLYSLFLPIPPTTTFYVNGTTGNNAWDGTSATYSGGLHGPFATIQSAATQLSTKYAATGVTINVAAGSYAGFIIGASFIANWTIVGAGVSTTSVTAATLSINNGVAAGSFGGNVSISGFTLSGYDYCVSASNCSFTISNCNLTGNNTTFTTGIYAGQGSSVGVIGTVAITGLFSSIFNAALGGTMDLGIVTGSFFAPLTVTFSSVTVGGSVSSAAYSGSITVFPTAPVSMGTTGVTGQRYSVADFGVVNTQGSGATYFPGTVAGAIGAAQLVAGGASATSNGVYL